MRVNEKKNSCCEECGVSFKNTKEMYDIMIVDTKFTLCFNCIEKVFQKTLHASVSYNNRIKSQEDMERIRRSQKLGIEDE